MVYYQSYEFNTVLEVEDMGFMVGKSSAKPSLKLHLLWLGMQPLYQDVKICDLALQTERGQCLNYSYIVITQFFSMIYCIGSRSKIVRSLIIESRRRQAAENGTTII